MLQKATNQVFDINKFTAAIRQILQTSEGEIYNILADKINAFKSFNSKSIQSQFEKYLKELRPDCITYNYTIDKSDIVGTYVAGISEQYRILETFLSDIDFVLQADIPDLKKEGYGIDNIIDISNKGDIVDFIFQNQFQIKGTDPFKWAVQNDYKIHGHHPVKYAIKKNFKIENINPVIWAQQNNISYINGIELLFSIVSSGYKIDGQDAVIWCINNKVNINTQDPLEFALANGYIISNQKCIRQDDDIRIHAWKHNYKIDGEDVIINKMFYR
ncbi:hypothetical protein [Orientia tsutsugamushi]|uniref:hypothetical protein n=1 Tax=Orientia tsutsugamushi TaxID=784 RepID=UPI0007E46085|nr:hypothetical protein [Orientia tsutsugamushi]